MDTPLDKLTEQFRRLPGIGVKTARKLAYYIVQQPNSRVDEFVDAIRDAKQNMHFCSVCFNLSSQDPCPICSDISRDRSTICVVETPQDVQAIERSGDYHGLYHVLHGALSPLDGVNVEDLRIRELLQRLGNTTVKEVILATDPDVEGEATALYLARLIKTAGIRVTRIARGLPMGGDIEYADEATLAIGRKCEGIMEYLWIAAGVFVLFLVHKLILAPMRHLVVNVVVGLIVLYGVNHFGYLFGFQHVPITVGTGLIIGLFGLPGVILVTLYYTFF